MKATYEGMYLWSWAAPVRPWEDQYGIIPQKFWLEEEIGRLDPCEHRTSVQLLVWTGRDVRIHMYMCTVTVIREIYTQ